MYHLVYLFFSQKPFSSTQMLQHSSCGHFCTFNSICGLHLINLIIYGGKFHFSPLQLQKIPQNLATVNNFPDQVEKEIKEPQIYEHFILFDFNQRRQSAQQMALVTVAPAICSSCDRPLTSPRPKFSTFYRARKNKLDSRPSKSAIRLLAKRSLWLPGCQVRDVIQYFCEIIF